MQTYDLAMIALIGMTLFVGLSLALYAALPVAVFDYARHHGRYIGIGEPKRMDDSAVGNTPVAAGLQGQSA